VIDTSEIDIGTILARPRTWNVLYVMRELEGKPPFGGIRAIQIRDLWEWTGEPWGGPVPPSTDDVES
jgi:hypothetical protein